MASEEIQKQKTPVQQLIRKTQIEIGLIVIIGISLGVGSLLLRLYYLISDLLVGLLLFSVIFLGVRYLWLNVLYLRRLKLMDEKVTP